jgi:hypothetical protein
LRFASIISSHCDRRQCREIYWAVRENLAIIVRSYKN